MKTIANRLIVFAAGTIAFGALAFGQTRMTAEIPFAFHTANSTLPAGTYEIREMQMAGSQHVLVFWNTASQKSAFAANPMYNPYRKASGSVVEFACKEGKCSLQAVRTVNSSLEYASPDKSRDGESKVAVILIPLKTQNAD